MLKPYLDLWHGDSHLVVDRRPKPEVFVSEVGRIVARYRDRRVYLWVDERAIEMSTPVAVKLGLAICAAAGECFSSGDLVYISLNGVDFRLLPSVAVQIGGVIVKKADRADDWQRGNPSRRIVVT